MNLLGMLFNRRKEEPETEPEAGPNPYFEEQPPQQAEFLPEPLVEHFLGHQDPDRRGPVRDFRPADQTAADLADEDADDKELPDAS